MKDICAPCQIDELCCYDKHGHFMGCFMEKFINHEKHEKTRKVFKERDLYFEAKLHHFRKRES